MKYRQNVLIIWLGLMLVGTEVWALLPEKESGQQMTSITPARSRSMGVGYRTISSGRQTVYVPQPAGAAYAPTMDQENTIKTAEQSGVKVERHSRLGLPVSVRGTDLGQRKAYSRGQGLKVSNGGRSGADAIAVVDSLSGVFGIRNAQNEFAAKPVERDGLGYSHTRLDQRYNGLRVVGGQLITHFNNRGQAYEVNGRYVSGIDLDVTSALSADEAVDIAREDLEGMGKPEGEAVRNPELVIFAYETAPALAYEIMVISHEVNGFPGRWKFWIDANDGRILLRFNDIKTATITGSILTGEGGGQVSIQDCTGGSGYYALENSVRHWVMYNSAASGYPDAGSVAYRTTSDWGTSDRVEMSAANNFDLVEKYYREVHGRNSFTGNGALAHANVHYGISYVNAYWDGSDFHFGDGDGSAANCLAVLDVCGHEFTHAVTEYSADLIYANESGALNESFSDILGACVEFFYQADGRAQYPGKSAGTADWLCGEDCWLASTALRDLRNPANSATVGAGYEQPTRYHGSYWSWGGEVHQNDGVQNFFFYLLSEGGSGTNDGIPYQVTGIGIANAARVAYRALTVYCNPYTGYSEARSAWQSAAADLNPAWTSNVSAAWAAVYQPYQGGPWGTEAEVLGGVAIDQGGNVYAASLDTHLYGFNPDGSYRHIWKLPSGSMATPTIGPDGKIIMNVNGSSLYIFNPDGTTNRVWPGTSESYIEPWGHPMVDNDGKVYTFAVKNAYPSSLHIYTLNSDGTTGRIWTIPDWCILYGAQSPVIGRDGNIYVTAQIFTTIPYEYPNNDGCLISFNPNGTTNHIWMAPGASNYMDGISYTPTIASDGSILVATILGKLYSFNPNGTTNYVREFPGFYSQGTYFSGVSPSIGSNGTIYIGGFDKGWHNYLYALNPDGTIRRAWNVGSMFDTNGLIMATAPTIGSDGTIYLSTDGVDFSGGRYFAGKLYAFNPDGATNRIWDIKPSYYSFPVIDSSGKIYIGLETGSVYVCAGTGGTMATNAPCPKTYYNNCNNCNVLPTSGGQAPSAPTGVSASDGTYTDKVRVTWTASSGALYYHVYRNTANDSGTAQVLGFDSPDTTCDDTTATAGVTYYYWVKTGNMNGESGFSNPDTGYRAVPQIPPSAPTGVSASDGTYTDKVRVSWNAASGATGYTIWRYTSSSSGSASQIGSASGVTYDDTSAGAGTVYYYWVKAVNSAGSSGFSPTDTGYRSTGGGQAPSAPTGISASDGTYTDKVRVSWNASVNATAYEVWRNTANNSGSALKQSDTGSSVYDDTSATVGVTYYYWVKAKNASGTSGFSASDTGYRSGGGGQAPSAPTGVTASDGTYTDKVRVSWNAVAGSLYYHVYRNTVNNSGTAEVLGHDSAETAYNDTSASTGVTYYYWVKAGNLSGESGFSSSDTGYRGQAALPSIPTGVSVSDGVYSDKTMVSWNAVSSATGYKIWRGIDNNAQNASMLGTCTTSFYLDTLTAPGSIYYYWIQAVNEAGTSQLSASDSGYCGSLPSDLASPTGVTASDGLYIDRIRIIWQAVNGTTQYEIWRHTENNSAAAVIIGKTAGTGYDDRFIAQGICYYYWIKAKTSSKGSGYSDPDTGWCRLSPPSGVSASDSSYPYHIMASWNTVANATWYEIWREEVPGINSEGGNLVKVAQTAETYFNDYYTKAGVYYRYKVKACNGLCSSDFNQDTGVRQVNTASTSLPVLNDYDGDRLSDLVLFNSSSGVLDVLCSALGRQTFTIGAEHSQGATGDLDGDGKADPLVYCPDTAIWRAMFSNIGYYPIVQAYFGERGNAVASADYDGDGLADLATYNEADGILSVMLSNGGTYDRNASCSLGGPGYLPVSADYDGDGQADPAVYSESEGRVTVMFSRNEYFSVSMAFGGPGQSMSAADFDGDGKADPVLYERAAPSTDSTSPSTRSESRAESRDSPQAGWFDDAHHRSGQAGTWTVLLSNAGYSEAKISFGGPGYVPAIGDYDGDGLADPAIYRESDGQWLIMLSASGYSVIAEAFGNVSFRPLGR